MIPNQPVPGLRRTTMFVNQDDGATPIARNSTFTGRLYLDRGDGLYVAASGILTNKRLPLAGSNFTFTVNVGTDNQKLHAVANTLQIIDGPFQATTTTTLPAGLALLTNYWITPFGADDFKVSTSLANAIAGVYVTMTTNGTGTHTWNYQAGTQRGIDGEFYYEFTQAETNQTANFLTVLISGLAGTNAPARAIVNLTGDVVGFNSIAEGTYTYGDEIRGISALLFGIASGYTTNTPQWKSLDGSKTRLQGTTTTDGRPSVSILDLT